MEEISIIGLDLAKNVFRARGAGVDGSMIFRRKLARAQLLRFLTGQPPCLVAIKAARARITGDGRSAVRSTRSG